MEVGIGRGQEIFILGAERRALTIQHVALHAVGIELRAEKISLVPRAEGRATVADQAGGRDARKPGHDRHQVAGLLELADDGVPLGIDAAIDIMQERVPLSVARVLEVGHGADRLSGGLEYQLDRIVETAAGYPLQTAAIRAHPPDARGQALEDLAFLGRDIEAVAAIAQVEPAVRTHERTVQTGRIGREVPAVNDHFAMVGHAVVIRVVETDQIGWGRNIEAAAIPDGACGERKVVREDGAAVVDPVTVGVFQHPDMVIRLGGHLGGGERVARRLTEEKASAVIDGTHHRVRTQIRSGHFFNLETARNVDAGESRFQWS